tara:strand:+ start:179 stop:943 length:765 start_codon:yes stop_codon:yes gene_type:complete
MAALPFSSGPPIGARAILGLIVLQADETIEHEFRGMIDEPGVALYATRIPSAAEVTPDSLATMRAALPTAAGLLPPSLDFDIVGYGCTSGATVIGSADVAQLVRGAVRTARVTDPLAAVVKACKALGARRLALVTPYVAEVSAAMRAALEAQGPQIAAFGSFELVEEAAVARIDPKSLLEAIVQVGRSAPCDAVFVSCTNLRTVDIIAEAEARLGKPVVSSSQALAWDMLRAAGIARSRPEFGRLMTLSPQSDA